MNFISALFRSLTRMDFEEDDYIIDDIELEDDYLERYEGQCRDLFPQRVNFEETWTRLSAVVNGVLKRDVPRDKWNSAFLDVYKICGALPKVLAGDLYIAIDKRVTEHVSEIEQTLSNKQDKEFIELMMEQNESIIRIAVDLNNLFRQLNNFISHESKDVAINSIISISGSLTFPRKHVGDLVMCRWKEKVLVPIAGKTSDLLLDQFKNHREGKPVGMLEFLKVAVDSFIKADDPIIDIPSPTINYNPPHENDIGLYRETFEEPLQKATLEYYREKAVEWSGITDSIELIENVANLIEHEKVLSKQLLHPSTVVAAEHWAADILVGKRLKSMKMNFKSRMNKDYFDEANLKKCFHVLKLIDDGLVELVKEFHNYVIEVITSKIGEQASDPKVFVNVVSEGHKTLQKIVASVFEHDQRFYDTLHSALVKIVNQPSPTIKAGDRLARFADLVLKKSKEPYDEKGCEKLVTVLEFLKDKEAFEKPYQILLANRLLGKISMGSLVEEKMIEMLRVNCSAELLQKFLRMCYDITQSNTERTKFYSNLQEKEKTPKFPIDFLILQTGAWPFQIGTEEYRPAYPDDVMKGMAAFNAFYTHDHTGRTLTWAPAISTVDVELTYLDKPYILTMTGIHYSILCCFDKVDESTVAEVCKVINMKLEPLKRYLKAFLDYSVLTTTQVKFENIQESTVLALNLGLSRKNNRIRLGIPMTNKAVKQEVRMESMDCQSSDSHLVDCVIVRIMKAIQKLKHAELVTEVLNKMKNRKVPTTALIKSSIESLIERAYIKRTDNIDEYEYVA